MGGKKTKQKFWPTQYFLLSFKVKIEFSCDFMWFRYHFFKDLICLFVERREGREKERERNINVWLPLEHPLLGNWPATQACVLTGNQNGKSLVHRPALIPLSHTNQGWFRYLLILCLTSFLTYSIVREY